MKNTTTQTTPLVQPYLFFGGRCEEALAFYRTAIGAQVEMVMKFKDSPAPMPADKCPPGWENKVMHSSFRVGGAAGATIMASDGCDASVPFAGFALSLALTTEDEVNRAFAGLSEGGKVVMPLAKTFWSARYGMLTDRFGVMWMVSVVPSETRP